MANCQYVTPKSPQGHPSCPSSAHPKSLKEQIAGTELYCSHHQRVVEAKRTLRKDDKESKGFICPSCHHACDVESCYLHEEDEDGNSLVECDCGTHWTIK